MASRDDVLSADEFKEIRHAFGFSQKVMGDMVSAGLQTVSEWERGLRPVDPKAARLAIAYMDGYRPKDWPNQSGHYPKVWPPK